MDMPMDIPAMSTENDLMSEHELINRDELRPRSLSIQIKNVETLQEKEEEKRQTAEDLKAAKSRNRKLDRIMRGSKSNLEYTKKVIQMVEADRNPTVEMSDKQQIVSSSAKNDSNVHKQHLDDMIDHIMSGKEFIPFSNSEDKARQSAEEEEEEEEVDAIDIEIKKAMEDAKK